MHESKVSIVKLACQIADAHCEYACKQARKNRVACSVRLQIIDCLIMMYMYLADDAFYNNFTLIIHDNIG